MKILPNAGRFVRPTEGDSRRWTEELRVATLSIGTYCVPVGGVDTQRPHTEDEVYVVMSGRARLVADSGTAEVEPGSVIYVPAAESHVFVDIVEDLAVLVMFAPPEYSRAGHR